MYQCGKHDLSEMTFSSKGVVSLLDSTNAPFTSIRIEGSLSNDDGDGNETGKKAIGFISKTTILHVHHAFL